MTRIRRILYATDFSTTSRAAFRTALGLAKSLGARLTIAYVLPPVIMVPGQYIDATTYDRLAQSARASGAKQLGVLAARAGKAGVKTGVMLREGDPTTQIIRACRSARANLIVVGTHGRHGLPRLLLGSVAERVISTASCPVVAVKGR